MDFIQLTNPEYEQYLRKSINYKPLLPVIVAALFFLFTWLFLMGYTVDETPVGDWLNNTFDMSKTVQYWVFAYPKNLSGIFSFIPLWQGIFL